MYSFNKKEKDDLKGHISAFNKLLYDLSNVGVNLDDVDKAIRLLTSVKASHPQSFSTTLYGRDIITLVQVKSALFSSEKMEKKEEMKEEEAGEEGSKNNLGDTKCFYKR